MYKDSQSNWITLVERLQRYTDDNELAWRAANDDLLLAKIGAVNVHLEREIDGMDYDYEISLYSIEGKILETASEHEPHARDQQFWVKVEKLWITARRKSLGLDEIWEDIFESVP